MNINITFLHMTINGQDFTWLLWMLLLAVCIPLGKRLSEAVINHKEPYHEYWNTF